MPSGAAAQSGGRQVPRRRQRLHSRRVLRKSAHVRSMVQGTAATQHALRRLFAQRQEHGLPRKRRVVRPRRLLRPRVAAMLVGAFGLVAPIVCLPQRVLFGRGRAVPRALRGQRAHVVVLQKGGGASGRAKTAGAAGHPARVVFWVRGRRRASRSLCAPRLFCCCLGLGVLTLL